MGLVCPGLRRVRAGVDCGGTSPSGTRGTRRPAARRGRTPSRRSAVPVRHQSPWRTTETSINTMELRDLVTEQLGASAASAASCAGQHLRHRARDDAALGRPGPPLETAALEVLPHAQGRLLLRLHGREHAVCRPRRPRGTSPGARAAGARLGGRLRDGGAADIIGASVVREIEPGELVAIDEHGLRSPPLRRRRSPRAACSSTSTSPGPTPTSAAAWSTRRASRWAASWPVSTRWTPTS